jgi:putative nucleotidyltransferase with HDIG domain
MTDDVPASQRWRGRPVHSLLLQAFVFGIPVVASVAAATFISTLVPRPHGAWQFIAWWVVLTAIALAVLTLVDRMARKLLPLAALLKLSMLFPDRAPSRFRVARNAASVRKLQEQLAAAREQGSTAQPIWAAESILTLITALGHHDRRSRGHSERVHVYAELLAEELDLPQFDRDRLRWAALLHDVGKLVIPAELLNKAGVPDEEEWDALRTHPVAGAELCAPLLPWLGEWGAAIAEHHEWYDGTGYPYGLQGHEISRAARIVAVADCYEVMTTSRTYKRALNPAAARKELANCAGTQFDPAMVRAFLNISLGRLRLAMGPLAMLSTVPSMARLSSLFEPMAGLARAGAVMGGAALIVGGTGVLPSPATPAEVPAAEAALLDSNGETVVLSETIERLGARRDAGQVADTQQARQQARRQEARRKARAEEAAAQRRRQRRRNHDGTDGGGGSTVASTDGSPRGTGPSGGGHASSPTDTPRHTGSPDPAPTGGGGGGTADDDLGADPTPPDAPPGQEPEPPDGPPASPKPPRNPRARGGF